MVNPNNVAGGHKATLNNPNTSEEAKQHSKEVLENEFGSGNTGSSMSGSKSDSTSGTSDGKNPNNVMGGHKATLNNPNTSEEAKQHSKDVLEGGATGGATGSSTGSAGDDGKNPNNVAGGLKATLSNPNTSEEAKQSAKERLDNM